MPISRRRPAEDRRAQTTNRITGSRRWWALAAVLITMFFASLDQTVVATAMPVIIGDLQGFNLYAWVFTAYLIASAVTVPIYGKLSDVYGRKPFYVFGLGLFMVGSALSGLSQSMVQLILFRGLQGIGAGAMLSMPQATIGDIFNPRERGRWIGVTTATFGLASIIGPFLGGWITDTLGWRWVFYINLPVAAVAMAGIIYALPRVRVGRQVKVDWIGSTLLIAGLIPMLLAFTWAGSQYSWTSPIIIGMFAFSAVALGLFGWAETRAPSPIIPLEFFRVRIFTTATLIGFLLSVGMFGTLLFLPLFIQGVLGLSAENSGAILTPMLISFMISSLIAGQIMTRTGRYKIVAIVSAAIMSVGFYLLTWLNAESSWVTVVIDMLVVGLGMGGMLPILQVAVQNAFPYRVMGVVSASQQFVRSMGGVIAAPILGSVLTNTFASEMMAKMPPALTAALSRLPASAQGAFTDPQTLTNAQTQAAIRSQFDAFDAQGDALYNQFITAVRESLATGMQRLFFIALLFGLATLLVTFFLPEIPLHRNEFYEETEEQEEKRKKAA